MPKTEAKSVDELIKNKFYCARKFTEEIEKLVDDIKGCSLLSFDIETTQLDPVEADIAGFALSLKENQGYYIPIIFPDKDSIPGYNLDLVSVLNTIKTILEDESVKKCGQNLKYDSLILKRHGISLKGIEFDSMIAEHILHPEKNSYKLDNLSIE